MSRRCERGASAVEFALIVPVLLLLIGGIIDFGRAYYQEIQLSNAARDGARLASLGTAYSTSQIQGQVILAAKPLAVVNAGVTVTACGGAGGTATVTVDPQTKFAWTVLQIVPGLTPPTTQGKASMTCV